MDFSIGYEKNNPSLLKEVAESITYKIIKSTMHLEKTATQISAENKIPLSSTYKKINRLCNSGILSMERISIDNNGKKVVYYKSKIRAIEAYLDERGITVHVRK